MAYASDFRTGSHSFFSDRATAIVASFRKAREQRKVYNRTFEELSSLTPRELDDLGIGPGEIPFIAREAANMVK